MKIALAQINPTIGDIDGNLKLIQDALDRSAEGGADLVVLPELSITGYPPKDLLLKPALIEECLTAVEGLAERCRSIAAVVGYPCPTEGTQGRMLYNAAALCAEGKIVHRHIKSLLPTYDVFDEHRYFEPGPRVDIAHLGGMKLGISICEDLWNDERMFSRQLYHDNPVGELAGLGAELFVNAAASPFTVRKHSFRLKLMSQVAKRYGLPLVYCNQVGGNDELVFDGNSCVFDAGGNLLAHGKDFESDLLLVDVPVGQEAGEAGEGRSVFGAGDSRGSAKGPYVGAEEGSERRGAVLESAYKALVLGMGDYCRKCGFGSIVLGLSGGIDSAVSAALCVGALGSANVRGIAMPSRYSSAGSTADSVALAERLGIRYDEIPIARPHGAFEELLGPYFEGLEPDVTEENLQARIRGVLLMAFSNKFGSLLVTTGNKSEVAVGYCTLYGDMAGGLAVLSDVPKTMVYELARWMNEDERSPLRAQFGGPVIPEGTITKPPSAELRPDQKDQDSLPDYDVLDVIVERYVERNQSAAEIAEATGIEAGVVSKVVRMIDLNEYKRKQMAPGLKITGRAFGFGRRMPIAQRYTARHPEETAAVTGRVVEE